MSSDENLDLNEQIMKLKLEHVMDGDEKKFRSLAQNYVAWVTSNNSSASDTPSSVDPNKLINESGHKRLLRQINQIQYLIKKSAETISTHELTKLQYADLQKLIKVEINSHRQMIQEMKENSALEKRVHQQKLEYESMVKLLERSTDRRRTEAKIEKLNRELVQIRAKSIDMDKKITMHKQTLAVFLQTSKDLAAIMAEDNEDALNAKAKEMQMQATNSTIPVITMTDSDDVMVVPMSVDCDCDSTSLQDISTSSHDASSSTSTHDSGTSSSLDMSEVRGSSSTKRRNKFEERSMSRWN